MGEVVMSGEKLDELARVEEEEESGGGGGVGLKNGLMRWEKFLPKMMLSVLLVEADDSTRQIIAALLRKCNYKVISVPDGLKAWEILKGRPHNIDLILTEVELPSISGYALLTLIMEHEIGKNIPVIMMSSQDSVSTVYKCMLRGAADYLVKPIRKNELRNLWQHVWRRQSSSSGVNGPQDDSVAQQKIEATAENHATSNHSSGDDACIQRNKELIEKGSDAQSSFTKPVSETESVPVDNVQELPQLKCGKSYPNETKMQEVETSIQLGQKSIMRDSHAKGLTEGICKNGETITTCDKDGGPEHHGSVSTNGEARDNHYVQSSSAREAIDLIKSFLNHPNYSQKSSSVDYTGCSPHLDLSLRGSHPSNLDIEGTEERHTLKHSNASAFKRYINRQLIVPPAALVSFCNQQSEQRKNSEKNISNIVAGGNSDGSTHSTQRGIVSPATAESKDSELATSHSQQGPSLPIAVKGIRFNDLHTAYGSAVPPLFSTQSGLPPVPSPSSAAHMEPTFQVNAFYPSNIKENIPDQQYEPRGQYENNASNHVMYMHEQKSEHVEDRGYISSTTDQSTCNSFCNANASQLNSIGGYGSNCGSNSNVDQAGLVRTTADAKNEVLANNGSSHRSVQREAALNKFRLKRKERCYEKKVRYESRKKLAEQRPRVKGQFVRQMPLAPDKDG